MSTITLAMVCYFMQTVLSMVRCIVCAYYISIRLLRVNDDSMIVIDVAHFAIVLPMHLLLYLLTFAIHYTCHSFTKSNFGYYHY